MTPAELRLARRRNLVRFINYVEALDYHSHGHQVSLFYGLAYDFAVKRKWPRFKKKWFPSPHDIWAMVDDFLGLPSLGFDKNHVVEVRRRENGRLISGVKNAKKTYKSGLIMLKRFLADGVLGWHNATSVEQLRRYEANYRDALARIVAADVVRRIDERE